MSTIQNIIDRKRYGAIRYAGKNEFTPLITTINNLHKTLSIQEKIRTDFLSDLSHEIRTPITAVQCYIEALED
jgi:signal transduction histidine kinase